MLLAARAITHLADVMPAACSSIVRHGAVAVLCSRLLSIEYIDLAEQSLQALQKLSQEHPQVGGGGTQGWAAEGIAFVLAPQGQARWVQGRAAVAAGPEPVELLVKRGCSRQGLLCSIGHRGYSQDGGRRA